MSADAKLEVDEETYLNQFKPHLMDVVFAWANGATFAQICKMTDVFEGLFFPLTVPFLMLPFRGVKQDESCGSFFPEVLLFAKSDLMDKTWDGTIKEI